MPTPEETTEVPTPALLFEVSEGDVSEVEDPETGETAFDLRFEARVILTFDTPNVNVVVRQLALDVAAALRRTRFNIPAGVGVGVATVLGVYPDHFTPELDKFKVWRLDWHQIVHLGAVAWPDDPTAFPPGTVLVGYAPNIGPAHVDDYTPV